MVIEDPALELVGIIEREGHPSQGQRKHETEKANFFLLSDCYFAQEIKTVDVVIEFTGPKATMAHLEKVVKAGKAMVIGTTGLTDEEIAKIKEASASIPIVFSPNMS
ncbi:MAG: 4-hydroxy-tetrahydrodipicolinate reductase, partial [Patescibacteria group bacterium]